MTLASLERRYRASVERTNQLRLERNQAILEAREAGTTMAEIARVTGLSSGRVEQILKPEVAAARRKASRS